MRHRHQHEEGAGGGRRDGHGAAVEGPGGRHVRAPGLGGGGAGREAPRPLAHAVPVGRRDLREVQARLSRGLSAAVVTAIGCDEGGWRRVLGLGVVDAESYDSWPAFLRRVRARGAAGVQLVTSDAHEGLRRAIEGVFQGAAWRRRVPRIVAPVFRLKGAGAVRAAYHLAIEMLESCRGDAARTLEEAEPDAPAYLDFPASHWKRPAHQQRAGEGEQ